MRKALVNVKINNICTFSQGNHSSPLSLPPERVDLRKTIRFERYCVNRVRVSLVNVVARVSRLTFQCTSTPFNFSDDYHSHQLMSPTDLPTSSLVPSHHVIHSNDTSQSSSTSMRDHVAGHDTPQNHQYECIPEYLLTMTRHHPHSALACHQLYHPSNTSRIYAVGPSPYTTFARSYISAREPTATVNTSDSSQCTCSPAVPVPAAAAAPPLPPASIPVNQEESSTPLLSTSSSSSPPPTDSPKNMIIGWTRRTSSTNKKLTSNQGNEQRHSFLSPFLKPSKLK